MAPRPARPNVQKIGRQRSEPKDHRKRPYGIKKERPQLSSRKSPGLENIKRCQERTISKDTNTKPRHQPPSPTSNTPGKEFPQLRIENENERKKTKPSSPEFWLSHTAGFRETTPTYALWKQLVFAEHPLAVKPWTIDEQGNAKGPITDYILNENHCALIACLRDTRTFGTPLINMRDLLIKASGRGNAQVVEFIPGFADSAASDLTKSLQVAAENGHLEVVDRLLTAKADVNAAAAELEGGTTLQAAAGGGHLEVVERLIAAKADVNAAAADRGRTALQAAAEGGHLEVVERLKDAGAYR